MPKADAGAPARERTLPRSAISVSPNTTLWLTLTIYAVFTVLELAASWIAYGFDREDRRDLWLLPTQRLVYRQIMYVVAPERIEALHHTAAACLKVDLVVARPMLESEATAGGCRQGDYPMIKPGPRAACNYVCGR